MIFNINFSFPPAVSLLFIVSQAEKWGFINHVPLVFPEIFFFFLANMQNFSFPFLISADRFKKKNSPNPKRITTAIETHTIYHGFSITQDFSFFLRMFFVFIFFITYLMIFLRGKYIFSPHRVNYFLLLRLTIKPADVFFSYKNKL